MKFLADENIPLEVVEKLQNEGIDIVSLSNLNPGIDDKEVLSFAKEQKRVLITFDFDFGKLIFKNKKESNGVILLRIVPQTIGRIHSVLKIIFAKKINFEKHFCVIEPYRLRLIKI